VSLVMAALVLALVTLCVPVAALALAVLTAASHL
jgi:hypothetical protein